MALFSKRHYNWLAQSINAQRQRVKPVGSTVLEVLDISLAQLAKDFQEENPRFDCERFLIKCGLPKCQYCNHIHTYSDDPCRAQQGN